MSNGVLGKAMTVANNDVVVYTVPATVDFATVSINLVNQDTVDATVKISIGTTVIPGPVDYIDFNSVLPANGGGLERTCFLVSAGENVIVRADTSNVSVRVYGLEKLL